MVSRGRIETASIRVAAALAAWMGLGGCGPSPGAPVPPPAPTPLPPGSVTAPASSADPGQPPSSPRVLPPEVDLLITLSPEPSPKPIVRVTIGARLPMAPQAAPNPGAPGARLDAAPLTVWRAAGVLDLRGRPEATDDAGPVPVTTSDTSGVTEITLARPASGTTWLSYTVGAELPAYPDPPPVAVDPDRFEGAGEALIAVPAPFEDRPVRAVIRTETDEIGTREPASAAGSFGHGHRVETTARGADLRRGFYLAGLLGHGTFRAPEGNDDAAWLGYTAFDPRPVFADMAGLRTALKQLFRSPDADKVTFLFVSDTRPEGAHVVTRLPRSVLARVGVQERWTPALRISVAAAVVHGWIGARLWIGPAEPGREAEAYWFTEGVTRHLARDQLFRNGLISPADAAEEVEGLASVIATSPLARASNEELARRPRVPVPLLVARGALYALRIDALMRAKRGGTRTLDHVLSELYARAAADAAPLPASVWVDAVARELGEGERAAFRDAIELGKPFDLPDAALGPCFRRVTRTYVAFDLGFDEDRTRLGASRKIAGLVKGGPAEKAGVRAGDELVSVQAGRRVASEPVKVTVLRDGENKTFTYKPEGKKVKGIGFERRKDVADDACVPGP